MSSVNPAADIKVSVLSPSDEPDWQDYVNSHPDATIYHTLEWRNILYNEYGFEPVYLVAKKDEKVVGILPMFFINNLRGKRLVSLPFSIYGGPISETDTADILLGKCVEMINKEGKATYLEINPCRTEDVIGVEVTKWGTGTIIDLAVGIDALWKGLENRRNVRKAVQHGLTVLLSGEEEIGKFYQLQVMTRKRFGLPTPSLRYYTSFFDKMPGLVKLTLIEKDGIPLAGGIFFTFKDTVLYALGASDHRYVHMRPNDMMIWEMMKWGSENGFKKFDLGLTSFEDKGLLFFKRKWGGIEREVVRYFFPHPKSKSSHSLSKWTATSIFSLTPSWGYKFFGKAIIKYLG